MSNNFLIVFTLISINVWSQNTVTLHRYTIELDNNYSHLELTQGIVNDLSPQNISKINSSGSILSIEFDKNTPEEEELKWLLKNPSIKQFQKVVKFDQRGCNPNDKEYWKQYNMELMKFDEVWCFKKDGISPLGDTLVIGAIDRGFYFEYQDLVPNIFANRYEIPDNGLDDDLNGYVDDYYGLNAQSLSQGDNHQIDNHGTQVISILGAAGNNQLDISGTNQNIKLLLCSADDSEELLRCYYYFIEMKRAYLNTSGKKGAFMVSCNLSAGFSKSFPADFPLICQVYDTLGNVGILNSVATINENDDIDLVGDIPGLCPGNHIIVVTNTNRFDQKVSEAGYSKNNVDIGASGEDVPMIDGQGKVRNESGTSFASPHIAGAVALLYQFCPKLCELHKSNPAMASSLIKQVILTCGDDLSSLRNITLTGKRLNMIKALECLNKYCLMDSFNTVRFVLRNNLQNEPLQVFFNPEKFGDYKLMIYNTLGQLIDQKTLRFYPDVENKYEISITDWPTGVYFVTIEGKGRYWSESLIKY